MKTAMKTGMTFRCSDQPLCMIVEIIKNDSMRNYRHTSQGTGLIGGIAGPSTTAMNTRPGDSVWLGFTILADVFLTCRYIASERERPSDAGSSTVVYSIPISIRSKARPE